MGWIGVDLDGTLAKDTGWKGADHIGEPIPAMVDRVKGWLADGKEVRILTARVSDNPDAADPIKKWCKKHLGQELDVTCEKDPELEELWDDKAVGVEHNKGTKAESIAFDLLEDIESKMPHLVRQFPDVPEDVIRRIATVDPTAQKTYITWLLRRYRTEPENIPLDDPDSKLRHALHIFDVSKRRKSFAGSNDIMSYATVGELLDIAGVAEDHSMDVVRSYGQLRLHHVTTPEAARKLAIGLGKSFNERQTSWCTVALMTAKGYLEDGPLYTVLRGNESYAQIHFARRGSGSNLQAKNAQNQDFNEEFARQLIPLFDELPDAVGAWSEWGMTYKHPIPPQPARWVIDDIRRTNAMEKYHQMFIAERWEGWSPRCRECRGTGRTHDGRCKQCNGEGVVHHPPYTNPNCPQCHGEREVDGAACPGCLSVIEQRWVLRRPIFEEIFNRAIEDNNRRILLEIGREIPAKPGYAPAGPQALFNVLHPPN